jgi:putative ABC transport system ATP-binding protein
MIEVTGVNKSFVLGDTEVRALNEIDLGIEQGEYVSVMGPSGSGKSTLLNMLGLLDRPDSGRYMLNGVDTMSLDENERARVRREEIGFVFQSYHLIARLTARENIELPLMLTGVPPRERKKA